MTELNDKLISYGNLSTFYDKLQEQGLGGNAIEDASVLPDAGENKSKLIRLSSDDNVYVSELKSRTSTTTNRLPDAQQIDKAYLYNTNDGNAFRYSGEWTVVCTNGELKLYGWIYSIESDEAFFSLENAEVINSSYYSINYADWYDSVDEEHKILYVDDTTENLLDDMTIVNSYFLIPIPATYNAPESAQIGNAYLRDGDNYYYNGIEYTLNYSDNVSIKAYGWVYDGNEYPTIYTPKKASEIYYTTVNDNKITDAKGYVIDYEEYPVVGGVVTLDYPFSEQSDAMLDFQRMYIPQLNAPDSEQVGNAYIDDTYWGKHFIYNGNETTIQVDGNDVSVYVWININEFGDTRYIYSTKPAYEIYNTDKDSDDVHFYTEDGGSYELTFEIGDLSVVSTVKYQRTEVIEEWDWQPLTDNATNDDIDAMFESSPVVKRVLMSDYASPLSIKEGLVNVSGETMEYEGQTYYKWVKYEEHDGESVIDDYGYDTELVVLTTSLNPSLPFSDESPEYAYHLVIDGIEGLYWGLDTYPEEALIHEDGSITYEE